MNAAEYEYVHHLLLSAGQNQWLPKLRSVQVQPMLDGGMGSLRFYSRNLGRRRAKRIAADEFKDSDGVPVSVEITIDQYGNLFELDSFKADFSPLHAWPAVDHS